MCGSTYSLINDLVPQIIKILLHKRATLDKHSINKCPPYTCTHLYLCFNRLRNLASFLKVSLDVCLELQTNKVNTLIAL